MKTGVFVNGSQSLMVSTNGSVCGLLEMEKGSYNMIMSDKELDYKDSEVIKKIIKSDFADQLRNNILKGMYESM